MWFISWLCKKSVFQGEAQRWAVLGCQPRAAWKQSKGGLRGGSVSETILKVLETVHLNRGNILGPDKITTGQTNWVICRESKSHLPPFQHFSRLSVKSSFAVQRPKENIFQWLLTGAGGELKLAPWFSGRDQSQEDCSLDRLWGNCMSQTDVWLSVFCVFTYFSVIESQMKRFPVRLVMNCDAHCY